MQYRCVATSVEGFVQQIAVSYVANGYFFYVPGCIPQHKDPAQVDAKIIKQYDIAISKWARARKKQNGSANLQYIRYEQFFLIMGTHGRHRFFEEEGRNVRDVRRIPIRFAGYSLSFRGGHASVRIESEEYRMVKAYFIDHAIRRDVEWFERELSDLRFQPYAPVRSQLFRIVKAVNRVRATSGLATISASSLRRRRRVISPFHAEPQNATTIPSA